MSTSASQLSKQIVSEPDKIKIKDYQIHFPPLGEGTFGTVYRATYRSLSDRALKIYRPGAVDIVSMARELEKLSKVAEHNGIVTLHDFDLLNDPPYYAMGIHANQSKDGSWETRTLERLCGHVDYQGSLAPDQGNCRCGFLPSSASDRALRFEALQYSADR